MAIDNEPIFSAYFFIHLYLMAKKKKILPITLVALFQILNSYGIRNEGSLLINKFFYLS